MQDIQRIILHLNMKAQIMQVYKGLEVVYGPIHHHGRKSGRLHQCLTQDIGHPKLREHLSSIVTIMKLSQTPEQFKASVNMIHPRYGDTKQIDFDKPTD